jgi:hypothetical protein
MGEREGMIRENWLEDDELNVCWKWDRGVHGKGDLFLSSSFLLRLYAAHAQPLQVHNNRYYLSPTLSHPDMGRVDLFFFPLASLQARDLGSDPSPLLPTLSSTTSLPRVLHTRAYQSLFHLRTLHKYHSFSPFILLFLLSVRFNWCR